MNNDEIRAAWNVLWTALQPNHFLIGFWTGMFTCLAAVIVGLVLS